MWFSAMKGHSFGRNQSPRQRGIAEHVAEAHGVAERPELRAERRAARLVLRGRPGSRNRNDIARRAVLGTLILGGPRVKELRWCDGHHVDLPGRRRGVPRVGSKSAAGVRMVPMVPGRHELLLQHRRPSLPGRGAGLPTRNGTPNTQNNILGRIVVPVRAEGQQAAGRA